MDKGADEPDRLVVEVQEEVAAIVAESVLERDVCAGIEPVVDAKGE